MMAEWLILFKWLSEKLSRTFEGWGQDDYCSDDKTCSFPLFEVCRGAIKLLVNDKPIGTIAVHS